MGATRHPILPDLWWIAASTASVPCPLAVPPALVRQPRRLGLLGGRQPSVAAVSGTGVSRPVRRSRRRSRAASTSMRPAQR